jgi:hypothetical protein
MAFKDYSGNITDTVGAGLKFFGSVQDRKAQEAYANALRDKGVSDVEIARIQLEAEKVKAQASKNAVAGGESGNTLLYVGLGIGGVLVLGVVIFAVTRKKA